MPGTLFKSRIIYLLAGIVILPALFLCVIIAATLIAADERMFEESLPVDENNNLYNHSLNNYIELGDETFFRFFKNRNPEMNDNYLRTIIGIYKAECKSENISAASAFCQMCHETNFLRYGGTVRAYQYNFAGIGSTSSRERGAKFPDISTGIRAHIQHIKAYSSDEDPVNEIVDPRFSLVKRKSAYGIMDLTGKWAADPNYGKKILIYIMELYSYGNITDIKND